MESPHKRKNNEETKVRGKDTAGNRVSGIRYLEYSDPAVYPLPESRRMLHGATDTRRNRAHPEGGHKAWAVFQIQRRTELES